MHKIKPHLWFDSEAEEAARLYTSVFANSKVGRVLHYGEALAPVAGKPAGSVMTVDFELAGQSIVALNGGPMFQFSEAVSFVVACESQQEVDQLWHKLSAGGQEQQCGWLKDKFGVSWQIVPTVLDQMLQDGEAENTQRVMQALLKMKKIDIQTLQDAYGARA